MTDHPEGRQPCPELAREMLWLFFKSGDGVVHSVLDDGEHDNDPKYCLVPCLVTPLLTADEREKLIGGEG